jgi:hypothetical protein
MSNADEFRGPKDPSEENDGTELLARAKLMQRNCHFEAALASYRDIAARYSHLPVGKEAQTASEALCPKQAKKDGDEAKKSRDEAKKIQDHEVIFALSQPASSAMVFWEATRLGCWSIMTPILAAGVTFIWLLFSARMPVNYGWGPYIPHGVWLIVVLWAVASLFGIVLSTSSLKNQESWPIIAAVGLLVNSVVFLYVILMLFIAIGSAMH